MKNLNIFVFGSDSKIELDLCDNVLPSLGSVRIFATDGSDQEVLFSTLELIRLHPEIKYQDMLVLYSGNNCHMLQANLPCDNLDMALLRNKLVEVAGGYSTPQQKHVVRCLFAGGILHLCNK
ncbi:MAG TPA: hypothetical protein PK526_03050 [bacterium]|nr:hypothetical protein [bacterium]